MALRGNIRSLKGLRKRLAKMPTVMAQKVATRTARALSSELRSAFAAGRTVYGESRPTGTQGNKLDLKVTGKTSGSLRFVAIGTLVRAQLTTKYARYLIRFGIMPNAGAAMPVAWSRIIELISLEELRAGVRRLGGAG